MNLVFLTLVQNHTVTFDLMLLQDQLLGEHYFYKKYLLKYQWRNISQDMYVRDLVQWKVKVFFLFLILWQKLRIFDSNF